MLKKSSWGIAAFAVALVSATVSLSADIAAHSVVSSTCADGSCVPRRLTNGYYPTTWRRWPVEPPSREKPGVREGISAPKMELPPPRSEIYLPEGVLVAPPPPDQGGPDSGFETGPQDSVPSAPLQRPAPPRGGVPQGAPPELRSGRSPAPNDNPLPPRPRAIAHREVNRPAAVLEALKSEAAANRPATSQPEAQTNIPAALPDDANQAQPLSPPPAVETPSVRPRDHLAPTSRSQQSDYEQTVPSDGAGRRPGRTDWSPTRTKEDTAHSTPPISQSAVYTRTASQEPSALRQAASGPNAPAAIYARTLAGESKRSASRANFTISAPQSPAALAVRLVDDEGWTANSQFRNPLRGASGATKVAFEDNQAVSNETAVDSVTPLQSPPESAELELPDNPLR